MCRAPIPWPVAHCSFEKPQPNRFPFCFLECSSLPFSRFFSAAESTVLLLTTDVSPSALGLSSTRFEEMLPGLHVPLILYLEAKRDGIFVRKYQCWKITYGSLRQAYRNLRIHRKKIL